MNRYGTLGRYALRMLTAVAWTATAALHCLAIGSAEATQGVRHPTPENIPDPLPAGSVLHETGVQGVDAPVFLRQEEADSVVIGVLEGEPYEMFGSITDVATDGLGTIFIMDAEYQEVRLFDLSGNRLGTLGRRGEGPGEFRSAREIAVSRNNVFVVDRNRAQVFSREGPDFVFKRTIQLVGMGLSGSCAMNDHLYHVGYTSAAGPVIHKIGTDGDLVTLFGEPYAAAIEHVRLELTWQAKLACNQKHGIVARISNSIPVLIAYTEDGQVVWRTGLADFNPLAIMEMQSEHGSTVVMDYQPIAGEGFLHTLFSVGGDHFYLGYYRKGEQPAEFSNHLFKVDTRTGEGTYLGVGSASAVIGDHVILSHEYPYPRVTVSKRSSPNPNR